MAVAMTMVKLIGICYFDVLGVCLARCGDSRREEAELPLPSAWSAFRGWGAAAPPAPKGGPSLQEGRSEVYSGWKRGSHRPSRAHLAAERVPGFTRRATAPPVPFALSLSP